MNTTAYAPKLKAERLTDAFQLFNSLSQNLSESYQELQKQVAALNHELASARTERVKTLTEKEKLADRLQNIIAALPAGVLVLNGDSCIVDCNSVAIKMLSEPLLGQSWSDVVARAMLPVLDNPHERQLLDGTRVNLTSSYLNNEEGRIVLLSDVSELRHLQDVVSQQRHLSAMGEMVASMAHQVRTPLSTAILYASQISCDNVPDAMRMKFTGKILERLQYLERQVNDMLIYAKEGRLAMEEFSLTEFTRQIKDATEELVRGHQVEFKVSHQALADRMLGNSDALLGAVINLFTNALEALQGCGRIEILIEQVDDSCLQIQVKDDGPGIAQDVQQRLFEPFYTTKIKGTGLGLAVVDSVARAHSGTVICRSEINQGTLFTLLLPCVNQYCPNLSSQAHSILEKNDENV
jgi:two-component system sensor histidine kinase FlrB